MSAALQVSEPKAIAAIERPLRRFQVVLIIAAIGLVWIPGGILFVVMVGLASATFLVEAMIGIRRRALRTRLMDADYKACLTCAAALRNVRAKQACPECGAPFDPLVSQAAWRQALGPAWPFGKTRRSTGK